MKIRASRFIRGGTYFVSFQAVDFTADDNDRFQKFGVPMVQILVGSGPRATIAVPINALAPQQTAGFTNPDEAKQYEERILTDVKALYSAVRDKKDEFTDTREVQL